MTTEAIAARGGAMSVSAGDGQALWFTTNRITIKATAHDTAGAFGLWESHVPPGSSPPLHVHRHEDETFWVLDGRVTIRCGDETFSAGPGDFAFLPRDVPHTFVAEGNTPAHLLTLATPGGVEAYFGQAGRPADNDGLPPAGPPDIELLKRVGERFGLEMVGPPLARSDAG